MLQPIYGCVKGSVVQIQPQKSQASLQRRKAINAVLATGTCSEKATDVVITHARIQGTNGTRGTAVRGRQEGGVYSVARRAYAARQAGESVAG